MLVYVSYPWYTFTIIFTLYSVNALKMYLPVFYSIATVFQLYNGNAMMYEMRRENVGASIHFYRLKGSLTSHTI